MAGTFNQSLQCTQDVFIGFQAPSPPVSEDMVRHMEAVGWANLAVVVARNLAITQGLCAVDTLLLMLHVQEVRNFEWWECSVVAEEAPAQDWGEEEPQQDCFGMSVAQ